MQLEFQNLYGENSKTSNYRGMEILQGGTALINNLEMKFSGYDSQTAIRNKGRTIYLIVV